MLGRLVFRCNGVRLPQVLLAGLQHSQFSVTPQSGKGNEIRPAAQDCMMPEDGTGWGHKRGDLKKP